MKSASPPYVAVIEFWPKGSAEVVKTAIPAFIGAVPSVVVPSMKVTVPPVGVAVLGALAATFATRVTLWPTTLGFASDVTPVVVKAGVTV